MQKKNFFPMPFSGLLMSVAIAVVAAQPDTTVNKHKYDFGAVGGVAPAVTLLDLTPVKNVAINESDLGLYSFDFSDNAFLMIGGMGYGGSHSQGEFGAGGWFGYKKFISASRSVPLRDSSAAIVFQGSDTVRTDSLAQLYTMLAYGGLMAEKNFPLGDFTFNAGGLFGGGALILGKSFKAQDHNSAFSTLAPSDSITTNTSNWTAAPLLCFEVHSGVSYKICSFLVVGADANLLVLHSSSGFNFNTDSFLTTNPGVRIRLMFGNLG
jgi:hypothetical protein